MLQGTIRKDDKFCATQHCNVGTMLRPFELMSQPCCNSVLRYKSLLRIVPCRHHLSGNEARGLSLEVSDPASQVTARLFFLHFSPVSFDGMKCLAKMLSRKMFLYQWFKCPHWHVSFNTVAQKGHTCKLKMLLQIKNSTCKLKIVHAN